ncbi:TusE/DsrC/DsvC family sulfur relay protein [Chloroflexota bacterium]
MDNSKVALGLKLNIEFDKEGFIMNTETWTGEVAEALAQEDMQAELTEDHWKVIDIIRSYFKRFGIAPPEQITCKETGFDAHHIAELFPTGYAQGACRIAGLPKPDPHLFGLRTNHA